MIMNIHSESVLSGTLQGVQRLEHVGTVNTPPLTHRNSFQRIWWINEFGGLTGYSLVLVHYIDTGKLWWIKWWWINENSLYQCWASPIAHTQYLSVVKIMIITIIE